MADPIVEKLQEDKLVIKATQRKRIRAVLIVINALLLSYFTFLLVTSIVDFVKTNVNDGSDDIICVNGKSQKTSKNIYDRYIDSYTEINDYALYGNYLYLSSTHITPTNNYYEDQIYLVKLETNSNIVYRNPEYIQLGSSLEQGIDLFSITETGDYFIAKFEEKDAISSRGYKYNAYHYNGEKLFSETIYTLPNEKGIRRQITVQGKASSPAIVISVKETTSFPSSYYDVVIIGEESKMTELSDTNYRIKYCTSSSPLVEAYLVNSTYCLNITSNEDESIISSSFINLEGTENCDKISGGAYDTFDKDNYIRELGGYIFNAGYGAKYEDKQITNASVEIMNHKTDSHAGKITLSLGSKVSFDKIKTILDF
ncbi:MAG: hypothetical protein ACI4U5_06435 [Bacilli bacterium]